MTTTRREFLASAGRFGAFLAVAPGLPEPTMQDTSLFDISLAQWSLHRTIMSETLNHLDFARVAQEDFGLDAIEYVNSFFKDQAGKFAYLDEMRRRAEDHGVRSLLIMVDGEGRLASSSDTERREAIENHFKWIVAAAYLGCHSIRVNAAGSGDFEDMKERAADSLVRLADLAEPYDVGIIVENHGGLSSNGMWLSAVMQLADHPRVGTLPDFGNFSLGDGKEYDRYKGVEQLMPWAKAVSAKSHEFDAFGNEARTDYTAMMRIVLKAGYHGYVGIEYEGDQFPEMEGIRRTKKLLERVRGELSG